MSNPKANCWQYKKCGREPGGKRSDIDGVCPAATDKRLHGIHGGVNSGRACWVISETLCKDEKQGAFAYKFGNCRRCDFYNVVQDEEFPRFTLTAILLQKLNGNIGDPNL